MYVTQPNEVYAIDARSGRQIWEYHRVPARQKGPNRGVAVWNDKVYFTTPDAFLIALHASTGNVIWETKLAEANDGYWSPGAPLVVKGKVIAGIAPGDHGLNGFLDAYDANTGERLWRYNPIPKPGEPGSESGPAIPGRRRRQHMAHRQLRSRVEPSLLGHRQSRAGFQWRCAHGRQPLHRMRRGPRPRYRKAEMVLPVHSSRHHGLGCSRNPDSGRCPLSRARCAS